MKKLFILIFMVGFLVSCSKDQEKVSKTLNGNYSLTEAVCFCAFDSGMNFSDYKLNFSKKNQTLTIIHPSEESAYFITEPGTYNYSLNNDVLMIEGVETSFKYKIEGNKLILTKIDDPVIADDELTLVYSLN